MHSNEYCLLLKAEVNDPQNSFSLYVAPPTGVGDDVDFRFQICENSALPRPGAGDIRCRGSYEPPVFFFQALKEISMVADINFIRIQAGEQSVTLDCESGYQIKLSDDPLNQKTFNDYTLAFNELKSQTVNLIKEQGMFPDSLIPNDRDTIMASVINKRLSDERSHSLLETGNWGFPYAIESKGNYDGIDYDRVDIGYFANLHDALDSMKKHMQSELKCSEETIKHNPLQYEYTPILKLETTGVSGQLEELVLDYNEKMDLPYEIEIPHQDQSRLCGSFDDASQLFVDFADEAFNNMEACDHQRADIPQSKMVCGIRIGEEFAYTIVKPHDGEAPFATRNGMFDPTPNMHSSAQEAYDDLKRTAELKVKLELQYAHIALEANLHGNAYLFSQLPDNYIELVGDEFTLMDKYSLASELKIEDNHIALGYSRKAVQPLAICVFDERGDCIHQRQFMTVSEALTDYNGQAQKLVDECLRDCAYQLGQSVSSEETLAVTFRVMGKEAPITLHVEKAPNSNLGKALLGDFESGYKRFALGLYSAAAQRVFDDVYSQSLVVMDVSDLKQHRGSNLVEAYLPDHNMFTMFIPDEGSTHIEVHKNGMRLDVAHSFTEGFDKFHKWIEPNLVRQISQLSDEQPLTDVAPATDDLEFEP